MTPLSIRLALPADAAALVALVNSAYRGDSSRVGWTTEADLLGGQRVDEESLLETIDTPGRVILVSEQACQPMGCVYLERKDGAAYLGMLTVRPTRQSSGFGSWLLEAAERWAAENWAALGIHMSVIVQRTELIAWYERRGYIRLGERKPFPYGDERFGVPSRDDLEFEVLSKTLSSS